LRTRVQFPPSPPIQKAARFWVAFFIGGDSVEFKLLTGSLRSSGTILNIVMVAVQPS